MSTIFNEALTKQFLYISGIESILLGTQLTQSAIADGLIL